MSQRELLGVPLGEKHDPLNPVVQAFRNKGVTVHPVTVGKLRRGGTNGAWIADGIACNFVSEQNDASIKYALIDKVVAAGKKVRVRKTTKGEKHRFYSNGYVTAMADDIGFDDQETRRLLRALRSDIAHTEQDGLVPEFTSWFTSRAEEFFHDSLRRGNHLRGDSPKMLSPIEEQWRDKPTVRSFYRLLHTNLVDLKKGHHHIRAFSIWTPYEPEVIEAFYKQLRIQDIKLTSLDHLVLSTVRNNAAETRVAEGITERLGIEWDAGLVVVHRNALAHGNVNNPFIVGDR